MHFTEGKFFFTLKLRVSGKINFKIKKKNEWKKIERKEKQPVYLCLR